MQGGVNLFSQQRTVGEQIESLYRRTDRVAKLLQPFYCLPYRRVAGPGLAKTPYQDQTTPSPLPHACASNGHGVVSGPQTHSTI